MHTVFSDAVQFLVFELNNKIHEPDFKLLLVQESSIHLIKRQESAKVK